MINLKIKSKNLIRYPILYFIIAVKVIFFPAFLWGSEKVIQQENMSFEKCLKVIDVSTNKLSIAPSISDETKIKRIAIFNLSDGKLKITCDGEKELIIVSTEVN